MRLMAVALLISNTIGHSGAKTIAENFATLRGVHGIDQAQCDAILREAALDYHKDRGKGLVERAFGGDVPGRSSSCDAGEVQRFRMVPTTSTRTGTPLTSLGRLASGAGGTSRLSFTP